MSSLPQENNSPVCVLLAVWGDAFIKSFLRLSLPSLLAPGNIPALANSCKTRFFILTRTQDIPSFEKRRAFHRLKAICDIEFILIDDLIVYGNYSTTLTLAYDRAIKHTGNKMLETYFVFLTSDYIMADGSLEGLMRYIRKGYNGIFAGNFQVIEEDMKPFLLDHIDPATHVMQIKPRDLLKESFQHLHPIVIASLFEKDIAHNYYANRFYIRYNQEIMAGRFYLLHMLCIKPETMDYKVGSSCDYSFMSEMCPSNNIAIINDSDDYLVIEAQSRKHELNYINFGSYDPKKLVRALAGWTTKQHRENANHSIYFHTRDITAAEKSNIEEKLTSFIDGISGQLSRHKEKPYRNHPYWEGAIKAFI